MKRFQFDLEPLLRLKRQSHRIAEIKQLERQTRKHKADQLVDERQLQLARVAERLSRQVGESMAAGALLSDRLCSTQIHAAIREAEQLAEQAEQACRLAAEECRRLAVEVEALENLRVAKWQEYRKQSQKKSLETLDDSILRQQLESQRVSRELNTHA